MRAIIDGKTYNTDTADKLCSCSCVAYVSSRQPGYDESKLYKTKKGAFFVAGDVLDYNTWRSIVTVVTVDQAKKIVEENAGYYTYVEAFGEPEEA